MSTRDFTYELTKDALCGGAGWKAVRASLLLAARTSKRLPGESPNDPLDRYNIVRRRWQARADELKRLEWKPMLHKKAVPYARNCPPPGILLKGKVGQPCGHRRICPFCFARHNILEAYRAIEWAVYGTRRRPRTTDTLVAVRRTFHVEHNQLPLPELADSLQEHRYSEANKISDKAGYVIFTSIEPAHEYEGWKLVRSTLALVPDDASKPADALFEDGAKMDTTVDVRMVDEMMGRNNTGRLLLFAIPYPLGMLHGDVNKAARIMEQAGGRANPMLTTHGSCRNLQARKEYDNATKEGADQ